MVYPASVATRQVQVGIPRDSQWNGTPATVILTPSFTTAVDTVGGDVVRGTPITVSLTATNAFTATVTLLASDTVGLSTWPTGFTWRVAYLFGDGLPSPAPFSVWIPTWTGGGSAPVLDLDLVAPVVATPATISAVPVVTPDQLAASLAALPSAAVSSVAGRTGAVVLSKADVGLASVDNVASATMLNRANHTGTQAASTVSGLATVATSGAYADLTGKPASTSGFPTTFTDATTAAVANSFSAVQSIPPAFTTIALATVNSDPGSNFNAATSLYTVPSAGTYLIIAKVRVCDGQVTTQYNLGMGVHTSNVDHPSFIWNRQLPTGTGSANRQVFDYQRLGSFAAGDQLRLYAYGDGVTVPITSAQLTILRLA